MRLHDGMGFSTLDLDNDASSSSCAQTFMGAWWYRSCHDSHLNGLNLNSANAAHAKGINWLTWLGHDYSLKACEMALKPV